jgi:secondary thiamine-phosphate synthase enzyme
MRTFTITTRQKDQVIDITDTVEQYLREEKDADGLCSLFVAHTTCALTTADLDPGTDLDLLDALRHLLPELSYRHPHDPAHTPDHILASLLGPALVIPYAQRHLLLGTWQRVILVELDGPRQRVMHLSTF